MFKKAGIVFACALVLAAAASAASWHVVRSGSAGGDFAVKAISATVNHPVAVGVRLSGGVSNGSGVIACSKNFGISSWHREYSHAGTYRLPQIRNADSCQVVASVGGAGHVTVQILSYR